MAFAGSLGRIAFIKVLRPAHQSPDNTEEVHTGLLKALASQELCNVRTVVCAEQCLETRLGPREWSLAGVVDLDLQVDGLEHAAHPGFQPIQLGRFTLQFTLILFICALQF